MVAQASFGDSVQDMLSRVLNFLPLLVAFLLILVIGWFVAKGIAKVLDRVLERFGFDRAVERSGVGRAMERTTYDPSDVLSKLVFYTLMLFVLQLAFGVFGENPASDLIYAVIAFLPRLFVAIVLVVVAAAVANAVRDLVRGAIGGLVYGRAAADVAAGTILVVGVFAALNQLRIAPEIVNGLFYALLAVVAGSAIVAIGGGGIGPMRSRWERALGRLDAEMPRVREEAQGPDRADEGRAELVDEPATGRVPGEYDEQTLDELYARAQARDLPGRSQMGRDELIRALRDSDRAREARR